MKMYDRKLLEILSIGHETSMRGEGISLKEALNRVVYQEVRASIAPEDLIPLIKDNPELIEQWIMYSEDKRTSGGWYITETGEIGKLDEPKERLRFASIEEAVAEYVVRELDTWANV